MRDRYIPDQSKHYRPYNYTLGLDDKDYEISTCKSNELNLPTRSNSHEVPISHFPKTTIGATFGKASRCDDIYFIPVQNYKSTIEGEPPTPASDYVEHVIAAKDGMIATYKTLEHAYGINLTVPVNGFIYFFPGEPTGENPDSQATKIDVVTGVETPVLIDDDGVIGRYSDVVVGGKYIYLSPSHYGDGSPNTQLLRIDTEDDSLTFIDLSGGLDENVGFSSMLIINDKIYLTEKHGLTTRSAAIVILDLKGLGISSLDLAAHIDSEMTLPAGTYDGRFIYYAPSYTGEMFDNNGGDRLIVILDTLSGTLDTLDVTSLVNTGDKERYFNRGSFDGRYIYFSPIEFSELYPEALVLDTSEMKASLISIRSKAEVSGSIGTSFYTGNEIVWIQSKILVNHFKVIRIPALSNFRYDR